MNIYYEIFWYKTMFTESLGVQVITCLLNGSSEAFYVNVAFPCTTHTQAHSQIQFKPPYLLFYRFSPIQIHRPSSWSPLKASVDKLTGKLTISKFQIRLSCTIYISSPIIRFPPHKATARRPYTPLFKKFSSRKIRSRFLANFHFS